MRHTAWASLFVIISLAVVCFAKGDDRYLQRSFDGGGGYHHASTVEEGAARGMADVIRSRGAANMMNSEAAINYEQARKSNIDKGVSTSLS